MSKPTIDVLKDEFRTVYSVQHLVAPTAKQFAAAEINEMLAEKAVKQAITDWEASIVSSPTRFVHCASSSTTVS